MDFFQHSNYRINKLLLVIVGLWPHQTKSESRFFLGLTVFFSGSLFIAQVRKVIIDRENPETIIEAVTPVIVDCICVISVLNSTLNSSKMSKMLEHVQKDFTTPMGSEEKVLKQCARDGRTFAMAYAVWIYTLMIFFLLIPITPKIIVACGFANISAPAQFAFPVDYNVDPEENYVYLQIHFCISVFFVITMMVSVDGMFVIYVQHACGIFSAIGYRLEHLAERGDLNFELRPKRTADEAFWIVVDCIKKHNEAIRFADLVDAAYSWAFFFIVGLTIGALSFTALQMALKMADGSIEQVARAAVFTSGELMHLFFECYFSQRLTDHSLRVYEALNKIRWYKTSMRTRKLLNFMLMRSTIPCTLKAGKMYIMSMENFSAVVRTSMSYFTLLCSMQ